MKRQEENMRFNKPPGLILDKKKKKKKKIIWYYKY
jgi:hypothetical protein